MRRDKPRTAEEEYGKDFKRAAELYKTNPKVLEQVYATRLAEAEVLVKSDKVADLERGRQLLNDYESRFPVSGASDSTSGSTKVQGQARISLPS